MLDRLALAALAGGILGYTLAKHHCRNEGEQRFNELMALLPPFYIDAIEDYLNGEPMLTQSIRDEDHD